MSRRLSPVVIQAVKLEYVTNPSRPSLRELAAKHGIGLRTLEKYAAKEDWATLREAHLRQLAVETARRAANAEAQAAYQYTNAREEATKIIRQLLDGLARVLAQTLRALLPEPDMTKEELQHVAANWKKLDGATALRMLPTLSRALAEVALILNNLKGWGAPEEADLPQLELTPEEEEMIHRILDRAQANVWTRAEPLLKTRPLTLDGRYFFLFWAGGGWMFEAV